MSALADAPPAGGTRSRRWLGLFFIALGVAMIIVDATTEPAEAGPGEHALPPAPDPR